MSSFSPFLGSILRPFLGRPGPPGSPFYHLRDPVFELPERTESWRSGRQRLPAGGLIVENRAASAYVRVASTIWVESVVCAERPRSDRRPGVRFYAFNATFGPRLRDEGQKDKGKAFIKIFSLKRIK